SRPILVTLARVCGPRKSGLPHTRLPATQSILYSPGCQFDTLSLDLLSKPSRSERFGGVAIAEWSHPFFEIKDGIVQEFSLGYTPLNSGRFEIRIPQAIQSRHRSVAHPSRCLRVDPSLS